MLHCAPPICGFLDPMTETLAVARAPGTPERGERWTADEVRFVLHRTPQLRDLWLLALPLLAVGSLLIAPDIGPEGVFVLVFWVLMMAMVTGGIVLPLSIAAWILRPAQVRVTRSELIVHDLAFNREQMARCGVLDGRIKVHMRDGRSWFSRRFTPLDAERIHWMLRSLPRSPSSAGQRALAAQRSRLGRVMAASSG